MIPIVEAERRILSAVQVGTTELVPWQRAHGRVLREAIRADRPSPPFDRIMMDGYALAIDAWRKGRREFVVQETVGAGYQAPELQSPDDALEVMTGGVLPPGCDFVVPMEWCRRDGDRLTVTPPSTAQVDAGLYVHARASDGPAGRTVLEAGVRLDPATLAVATTEGATTLTVTRKPRVALVTTGDEVVRPEEEPKDWQIRGSHGAALSALVAQWGPVEWSHTHAVDDEGALRATLSQALDGSDILLTVGGVSRGKWDLVPGVLQELGVEERLHRVAQRPGKPIWFGVREAQLVFGLPGNPVSALCSARRHLWPALDRWSGMSEASQPMVRLDQAVATLSGAVRFVPVTANGPHCTPIAPQNSGALHALAGTIGFVECPANEGNIPADSPLPFFGWNR
jgi:molybdopterin molybdotransferase